MARITMGTRVSLAQIAQRNAQTAIVRDITARRFPCAADDSVTPRAPLTIDGITCAARVKTADRALTHGPDGHEYVAAPTAARRGKYRAARTAAIARLRVAEDWGVEDPD